MQIPIRLLEIHAHSESCRAARFINDGQAIITGSSDRSILATDLETGSPIARLENAHEDAIFSLINLTESTVASGDDQGCVKVTIFHFSLCLFVKVRYKALFPLAF
ncbi:hypothetical protein DKX38_027280 [Salix brachista]|uniref:Uncharacterized protein n=1 Tax=Salix brachista TaxID=2182728 RepID=A0A5N5JCJ3_9ROSI|nr:hypothetical protein DKX38_027280 [Salix brachista]